MVQEWGNKQEKAGAVLFNNRLINYLTPQMSMDIELFG